MRVAVAAVLLGAICASANPRHLLDDTVKVRARLAPLRLSSFSGLQGGVHALAQPLIQALRA